MKGRSKIWLGIGIALITAGTLQLTVGHRFHHTFRRLGHHGCGQGENRDRHHHNNDRNDRQRGPEQGFEQQ